MQVRRGTSADGHRGSCFNCADIMSKPLEIDLFAKKVELRLPNGSTRYTTFTGCICTLLYLALVFVFAFYTMRDIVDRKRSFVSTKVEKDYWDALDVFPPIYKTDHRDAMKDI